MVVRLLAVFVALMLLGSTVRAADLQAAPATAAEVVELPSAADPVVPVEMVVVGVPVMPLLWSGGSSLEMPPVTRLLTYLFAPRMDRPPRN